MTSRELFRAELLLSEAARAKPVLGLDTGASVASLALAMNGKIVAQTASPVTSHGSALPAAASQVIAQAGISPRDLGAIAVGIGPGSFTGLRIGLSYAKGIAFATGCGLVGINSLDALAMAVFGSAAPSAGSLVCPIVDARKGEVYTSLYRGTPDGLEKVAHEMVLPLARLVAQFEKGATLVGDTKATDAAAMLAANGVEVTILNGNSMNRRAEYIAAAGAARLSRSNLDRAESLEPLYVRPPEAASAARATNRAAITEGVWSAERKNSFGSI